MKVSGIQAPRLKFEAEDKAGMTLDELEEVVKQAREAGVDGDHRFWTMTTIKGRIKSLRTYQS